LDYVIIVELLAERRFSLRQFSKQLREQIDNWGERSSEKSVLYQEWIRGAKWHSKAAELFGSLQIPLEGRITDPGEWCRRKAYLGVLRAIILRERSKGLPLEEISRRWKVEYLAGVEEAWRDDRLWLLNALGGICDLRCFIFVPNVALRKTCAACEAVS
jgi:hypothetical protein